MAADMGTLQRLPKIVGNDSLVREYAYSCAKIEPQEAKTVRFDFLKYCYCLALFLLFSGMVIYVI